MIEYEHLWQQILPANVHISVGSLNDHFLPLTIVESTGIDSVSSERLIELKAGRAHARKALAKIDIYPVDIIKDKSTGAPVWPESIVGSITHSSNSVNSHIAVAVAKKKEISSLGIDVELGGNIHPKLWKMFLSEDELSWLNSKSFTDRSLLVRKMWSLKEAAIKASANLDMLLWRVRQASIDSDSFELTFNESSDGALFNGRAICKNNMTFAAVYAEYKSGE